MSIKTLDLISIPQGITAMVLPERLRNWYQVEYAVPHVSPMVADKFESKDLGPMIKRAGEV